jgi:hypothetical protein
MLRLPAVSLPSPVPATLWPVPPRHVPPAPAGRCEASIGFRAIGGLKVERSNVANIWQGQPFHSTA